MGELEGALARLEWDGVPRKALQSRACGPRSGDFWAGKPPKSNGIGSGFPKPEGVRSCGRPL